MDLLPAIRPDPQAGFLSRRLVLGLVGVAALGLSGCSSLDVTKALPEFRRHAKPPIDRAMRVATVEGPPPDFGSKLTNERMHEALEAAIKASGLYRSSGAKDSADLELRATILSTRLTKPRVPFVSMEARRELIVAYEVVDLVSARSLFRETYRSEAGSTISGGYEAGIEITTISLRENLRLLFEALNERQPGAPR